MVLVVEVVVISKISGHLECESTTTKNDFPKNVPAKSMCIYVARVLLAMSKDGGWLVEVHAVTLAAGAGFGYILNVLVHARPPYITSSVTLHSGAAWVLFV